MKKLEALRVCLFKECPSLDESIIRNLEKYIIEFNLSWFPGNNSSGVNFFLSELAKIKKTHSRSMTRSVNKFLKSNIITNAPVKPKITCLKAKKINKLRKTYRHLKISKYTNNLNICNWAMLYAFIIDPKFIVNNKKSIKHSVKFPASVIIDQLHSLSGYAINSYSISIGLDESKPEFQNVILFDFVCQFKKYVDIYKIMPGELTISTIVQILAEDNYLDIASKSFNKQINFYFAADIINENEAKMIKMIDNVNFISINQLVKSIKQEIFDRNYRLDPNYLEELVSGKYPALE